MELATRLVLRPVEGGNHDQWKASFPRELWLTGTIDYLRFSGGIDDLKTGRYPPPPHDNRQLLSYALYPWLAWADGAIDWESTVSITHWPKYPLNVQPARMTAIVTGFQLMEHLEDLRWAAANPYDLQPSSEGCQWCPSRAHCERAV